MSIELKEGARVTTKYGPGKIVEVRGLSNIIIELETPRGLRIRQTQSEIVLQESSTPTTIQPETTTQIPVKIALPQKPALESAKYLNLKALEALRFGLVPQTKLAEMTIGFDDLKSWLNECLPHSRGSAPCVAEVCGPYGTGKSHTMSVIRHVASQEGYVTAHLEIDGKNITLGDPETLLANLWTSIRAEGLQSSTPLLDLYVRAINNNRPAPRIAPHGTDRIASNYRIIQDLKQNGRLEAFEYMIDAILSSSNEYTATEVNQTVQNALYNKFQYVRRMIGRTVAERPSDFIESLVGHAKICQLAGYKGLLLTIDEFEVQRFEYYWDRVQRLIEVMTNYFAGDTEHPPVPCAVFFATVGELGHRGDAVVDEMIEKCDGHYRELKELEKKDLIEIAIKIYSLYQETYNIKENYSALLAETAYKAVRDDKGLVRAFIKQYVSILDEKFGPPDQ